MIGLIEKIEEWEEDFDFETEILNHIVPEDRASIILLAGEHILGDGPVVELSAWMEAAVYEVYQEIETSIEIEIDYQTCDGERERHNFFNRKLLLEALKEAFSKEDLEEMRDGDEESDFDKMPTLKCVDNEKWSYWMQMLLDGIIWDTDFLMYNNFADKSPKLVEKLKVHLGIAEEYYTAAPPPVTVETRKRLDKWAAKLIDECNEWYGSFTKKGRLPSLKSKDKPKANIVDERKQK